MKPPLEILVVRTEIRLGLLLVLIAESAYNVRGVDRGDEARARGQAAYVRATRLLAQVAEGEQEPLARDLEPLQNALSHLSKNEQSGGVIRDKARPEEPMARPLEQLLGNPGDYDPFGLEYSKSGCDESGSIDPLLIPKHFLFLFRIKSFLFRQSGQQIPSVVPRFRPVTEKKL